MRELDAPYDPNLNQLSGNQDQTAKALFELGQAIREAAADGKLEPDEVFALAAKNAPAAAAQVIGLIKDPTPLGEDLFKVAFGVVCQFQPFEG